MEEVHAARESSGIYEGNRGSTRSLASGSTASLRGVCRLLILIHLFSQCCCNANIVNAPPPAGSQFSESNVVARTTPAGVVAGGGAGVTANTPQDTPDGIARPAADAPRQPFYKRRWFIISQIIIIPLGIALLFIVLFPVVRAIVQLVVKRSTLDIQVAAISQPQNNT